MEFEKIEGSRKGSFIYCANGYIYTKNNEYKGKINLRCHSYKKGCCGTAAVENGIFFRKSTPHSSQKSRWNPKDQNRVQNEKRGTKNSTRAKGYL